MSDPASCAVSISVVIPSLNAEQYIAQCLDSVLEQDFPAHEIIIQDGGSTDGTAHIVMASYPMVVWYAEHDRGQSDAVNRGLAKATGDLVLWLNADDIVMPKAFSAVAAAAAAKAGASFYFGGYVVIDANGSRLRSFDVRGYSFDRFLRAGCYMFSGAIYWKREVLCQLGALDTSLHYAMDLDLMLRARDAGPSSVHVPGYLSAFRIQPDAKGARARWRFGIEVHRLRAKYAGVSHLRPGERFLCDGVDALARLMRPVRYSRWYSSLVHPRRQ